MLLTDGVFLSSVFQVPAGSGGAKAGTPLASDKLKTVKVKWMKE